MGSVITTFDLARFTFDKDRRNAVLAPGCFDILHSGHIRLLERAAQLGSPLIVAINSDDSVRRLKGLMRPVVPARDRAEVVAALAFVSFVLIFDGDLAKLIAAVKPRILVKGADWMTCNIQEASLMESIGGHVEFIQNTLEQSTTKILASYERRANEFRGTL